MASNRFVSLQRPNWWLQNDEDAKTAMGTRQNLTRMVREKGWTVFAPHFPWPGVGHVVEENGQVSFKNPL